MIGNIIGEEETQKGRRNGRGVKLEQKRERTRRGDDEIEESEIRERERERGMGKGEEKGIDIAWGKWVKRSGEEEGSEEKTVEAVLETLV